jgi:ABC-type transporter Mla subunit MlaD
MGADQTNSPVSDGAAGQDDLLAAAGAVGELVKRISAIRQGSERQAQLLGEIAHTIELVGSDSEELAGGAAHAAELAVDTRQLAHDGSGLLHGVLEDLEKAVRTVELCLEQLAEFAAKLEQVSGFTAAIEAISRQTKLLALNAAIEAARAGEHGRGFSVVADEVKRLAEDAAAATNQISATVAEVGQVGARSVSSSGELGGSLESLRTGLDAAREAADVFERIVAQVDAVTEQVVAMSDRTATQREQAGSARDGAQVMSAQARQTAAAVEELRNAARLVGAATDSLAVAGLAARPDARTAAAVLRALAATLRPLFDVPRIHAGGLLALAADRAARGRRLLSADLAEMDGALRASLDDFDGSLCGVTVTLAPGRLDDQRLWMQWWAHDQGQLTPDLDPASPGYYDYTTAEWYEQPLKVGREYLSAPYFDEGGADAWIVTLSVPVSDEQGILGVTTADMDLAAVSRLCAPALRRLSGPAALVTRSGLVVTSSDPSVQVGQPVADELRQWIADARDQHATGPGEACLSWVPTLDWLLLEL